jgi:hypothetical protein
MNYKIRRYVIISNLLLHPLESKYCPQHLAYTSKHKVHVASKSCYTPVNGMDWRENRETAKE